MQSLHDRNIDDSELANGPIKVFGKLEALIDGVIDAIERTENDVPVTHNVDHLFLLFRRLTTCSILLDNSRQE
jgi:hypothetical protein